MEIVGKPIVIAAKCFRSTTEKRETRVRSKPQSVNEVGMVRLKQAMVEVITTACFCKCEGLSEDTSETKFEVESALTADGGG
jgi:hypothetical protein